ncbi:MAG: rod shape-determining protein MreD [Acidobacteriaceae bacterium]
MALFGDNPREEMDRHRFPLLVYLLVPLLAVLLQAYLPLRFPRFAVLDLPLLVTIYFSVTRRAPIHGTLLGAAIGLTQDALTHLPLGINGTIKAIVGYLAASTGLRIDVENPGTRLLMVFFFSLMASLLHQFIVRYLLGMEQEWRMLHELLRAVVNAPVAVVLFALLDRLRQGD